jgi:hypothetical protein
LIELPKTRLRGNRDDTPCSSSAHLVAGKDLSFGPLADFFEIALLEADAVLGWNKAPIAEASSPFTRASN